MADDRGNIRGSPEPDRAEGIVVGFHHTRNTHTVRVLGVAVECKLMGDLEEERRRKGGGEPHKRTRYKIGRFYLSTNVCSKS